MLLADQQKQFKGQIMTIGVTPHTTQLLSTINSKQSNECMRATAKDISWHHTMKGYTSNK